MKPKQRIYAIQSTSPVTKTRAKTTDNNLERTDIGNIQSSVMHKPTHTILDIWDMITEDNLQKIITYHHI